MLQIIKTLKTQQLMFRDEKAQDIQGMILFVKIFVDVSSSLNKSRGLHIDGTTNKRST